MVRHLRHGAELGHLPKAGHGLLQLVAVEKLLHAARVFLCFLGRYPVGRPSCRSRGATPLIKSAWESRVGSSGSAGRRVMRMPTWLTDSPMSTNRRATWNPLRVIFSVKAACLPAVLFRKSYSATNFCLVVGHEGLEGAPIQAGYFHRGMDDGIPLELNHLAPDLLACLGSQSSAGTEILGVRERNHNLLLLRPQGRRQEEPTGE